MSVYVDRLPDSCGRCVCNNDDWICGITHEDISHDGRREDCPLIEIVRCKDCKHNWDTSRNHGIMRPRCNYGIKQKYLHENDYCSYGEKQVTGKLNNPDDSLLTEDSEACKEQKSKLESEELQLSPKTSTNGTYIRDGRLMHDLVYRGEAEVTNPDLISRQAVLDAVEKAVFKGVAKSAIESLPPAQMHDKHTETHACDCISRQAVIDLILDAQDGSGQTYEAIRDLLHEVAYMPPVEPKRPEIIKCENCRHDNNCEIQYAAEAGSEFFCGLVERM